MNNDAPHEVEPTPSPEVEHFPLAERLHTDVLEAKYGPIHAEVVRHDDEVREAHLVDEAGISRTYALTFFPEQPANEDIQTIDLEIRAGGSIGKVFREHGYAIRKNVIDVFTLPLPQWLTERFAVTKPFAKARLSEFYARKEAEDGEASEPVVYGTVVEVYTPDFRPAFVNDTDRAQISASTEALARIGISRSEIWERLGRVGGWEDLGPAYQEAQEYSLQLAHEVEEKVREYVQHH